MHEQSRDVIKEHNVTYRLDLVSVNKLGRFNYSCIIELYFIACLLFICGELSYFFNFHS